MQHKVLETSQTSRAEKTKLKKESAQSETKFLSVPQPISANSNSIWQQQNTVTTIQVLSSVFEGETTTYLLAPPHRALGIAANVHLVAH